MPGSRDEYLSLIAADHNAELRILVSFPLDEDTFCQVLPLLRRTGVRYGIDFLVQEESDLRTAHGIVSELKTESVSFKACYDGMNAEFLKKALFLSRADIVNARPGLRDVFARMTLNPLNFGRLVVFSDGAIRANVNAPALGRLGRDSLHDLVHKELVNGRSWRTLRASAGPCKTCRLSLLCPPLTNYEFVLGRRNLCDVLQSASRS